MNVMMGLCGYVLIAERNSMNKDIETLLADVAHIKELVIADASPSAICDLCDKVSITIADRMERQSKAEPLYVLHLGGIVDGEYEDWDAEPVSWKRIESLQADLVVDANTVSVPLYAHPPADARDVELLGILKAVNVDAVCVGSGEYVISNRVLRMVENAIAERDVK